MDFPPPPGLKRKRSFSRIIIKTIHHQEVPLKSRILLAVLAFLLLSPAGHAKSKLVENGTGVRTKMILGTMYELTLNVSESLKGAEARELIESAEPMELVLTVKSKLINRARFVEATSGGFAKAAESGYESKETETFLKQFDDVVFHRGDIIRMCAGQDGLTTSDQTTEKGEDGSVTLKNRKLGIIKDPALKKALFAIWLGNAPVQESLKKALLGEQ